MSRLRLITRQSGERLSDDAGFTLIELMVACLVGIVVIIAATNLIDSSGRASVGVLDRVDGVQRGRVAMEQITQRLRTQVCPADGVTPVLYGDSDQVTFYADLSTRTDGLFQPEVRRIRFVASEKKIYEDVWDYQTTAPTATTAGSPTVPAYAATLSTSSPAAAPTSTRVILANVSATTSGATTLPVFTYFGFNSASPPTADLALSAPLSSDDRDLVARVGIAFDSQPTRNAGGNAARDALNTRFENSVFARTADPLQPTRDPVACI